MSTTLTARKRVHAPHLFTRRDARTLALRLTYGPQSNADNGVQTAGAHRLPKIGSEAAGPTRAALQRALDLSGWPHERRMGILANFDRSRSPNPEATPAVPPVAFNADISGAAAGEVVAIASAGRGLPEGRVAGATGAEVGGATDLWQGAA